jgi:predicted amidophosphoribosyltransferase
MKLKSNYCPNENCNNKLPMSKAFCNRICKDAYFEQIKIQFTKPFIKRIFLNLQDNEIVKELKKYAKYHKYNIQYTINKAYKLANEYGYTNKKEIESWN